MNRRGWLSSVALSPTHEQQSSLLVGSLLQCMHLYHLLFCLFMVLLEEGKGGRGRGKRTEERGGERRGKERGRREEGSGEGKERGKRREERGERRGEERGGERRGKERGRREEGSGEGKEKGGTQKSTLMLLHCRVGFLSHMFCGDALTVFLCHLKSCQLLSVQLGQDSRGDQWASLLRVLLCCGTLGRRTWVGLENTAVTE